MSRQLTILREWGRIGWLGFGGPPTHIKMLREMAVERRAWISAHEFEDAVATCNLLPGPSSTQLAIFTAWRVGGPLGAIVGGLAFIVPGFLCILALAALFLGHPPAWVLGAGAGAGAAVAGVALQAGWSLVPASSTRRSSTWRWRAYLLAGALAAALLGPYVVLVLLACGAFELLLRLPGRASIGHPALLPLAITLPSAGLAWTALKVGALSYGGGFVIIPLMQSDAVRVHHWMTPQQFLDAVALGQVTPGPVVHTVAVIGWAASGLLGACVATVIAFSPSFIFVLGGGRHFDRLRTDPRVRAFLDGAGPAAIGAILGSAWPLAHALSEHWQWLVCAVATVYLLAFHGRVLPTLLAAAAVGVLVSM